MRVAVVEQGKGEGRGGGGGGGREKGEKREEREWVNGWKGLRLG